VKPGGFGAPVAPAVQGNYRGNGGVINIYVSVCFEQPGKHSGGVLLFLVLLLSFYFGS
jgi:hypothetical protein